MFLISCKHLAVLPPSGIDSSSPFNHNLSPPFEVEEEVIALAEVKERR